MTRFFPTEFSEFADLRRAAGHVYIDKTRQISALVPIGRPAARFLSRPRRFGKTLLVSTLEALFQGRHELFAGTWIGDSGYWDWKQKPYPVIRLDMAHYNEPGAEPIGHVKRLMQQMLQEQYEKFDLSPPEPDTSLAVSLANLIRTLHRARARKVVILIDEYDTPVTANLHRPEVLDSMLELMRSFYGTLKRYQPHIHFTFMTGITRIARAGLFSGANHFTDLSFETPSSILLGYTRADMHNSTELMAGMAQGAYNLGCSVPTLLEALEHHYNGYLFAEGGEPVYNPFSLNACLEALQDPAKAQRWTLDNLPNFWAASGQTQFLFSVWRRHLQGTSALQFADTLWQASIRTVEEANFDVNTPDLFTLMYQTGYLTRKRIQNPDTGVQKDVTAFPNREVEITCRQSFLKWLQGQTARWRTDGHAPPLFQQLRMAVETRTAAAVSGAVNDLLATIPHTLHVPAVARKEDRDKTITEYEIYCQATLFSVLRVVADDVHLQPELAAHRGRMDLGVPVGDHILIFELKVDRSADQAGKQALARGYASLWRSSARNVTLLGLNFNTGTHQLDGCVQWDLGQFDSHREREWDREPFADMSLYTMDLMAKQDLDREKFVAAQVVVWHDQYRPQMDRPSRVDRGRSLFSGGG